MRTENQKEETEYGQGTYAVSTPRMDYTGREGT
jgi:hypothetical protein